MGQNNNLKSEQGEKYQIKKAERQNSAGTLF
jgi:hypothetical protein